jgi:predicted NAD/FAD-binding protein
MAKIAIIGTGIAGLSASYHLNRYHDVTVYEKDSRVGGHTRTRLVNHGGRQIPVDTGFIVFNERNYPNLTALFRQLGVAVEKSDMSFALTVRNGWLEWSAQSINTIFGQRRNVLRPDFIRLFSHVAHFNANAIDAVESNPGVSLGELVRRMGLGDWFRWYYLLPMAGAIWSCPPRQMLSFPAATFVRFFANHGLLSANGQPQWHTVTGGAQSYIDKMTSAFSGRIRTKCAAVEVRRADGAVSVRDAQGNAERYDHVVLASHADESLKLLCDADDEERALLGAFGYQRNRMVLHKDPQFMPRRKHCWASWVYHSDGKGDDAAITVSYWMNRLQNIDRNYPLFVTLNPQRTIPDEHVFDEHEFMHPVFDEAAIAAQSRVQALQGRRNVWFCGAYLGYGFHEDGHVSGLVAANALNAATGNPIHTILPLPAHTPAPVRPRRRPIAPEAEPVLAFRGLD